MANVTAGGTAPKSIQLLKVLGPTHVWALGVGIVLVGEFMGWNYAVDKGGALGALIACWVIGLLYTCVAMIDSEVTSTVAAAGGQYTQAKHTTGPLMAFNVGLYLVLAYTMLEAGDIYVVGVSGADRRRQLGYAVALEAFVAACRRVTGVAQLSRRLHDAHDQLPHHRRRRSLDHHPVHRLSVRPWKPGEPLLQHADLA